MVKMSVAATVYREHSEGNVYIPLTCSLHTDILRAGVR